MALTTQDIVKGLDLTGLTSVNASQLNQEVDVARVGADKGITVQTTDTALDTPEVPNPNGNYAGILPIWWKRYRWSRILFDGSVKFYYWQESAVSVAIYLKWQDEDAIAIQAAVDVTLAQAAANAAAATSANALSVAHTASLQAVNALSLANNAKVEADANAAALVILQEIVNLLWTIGDVKATCKSTVDTGWLECNGQEVLRSVYSGLFDIIGTTWGAGDAVTTYNLPDFRGRTLINRGGGPGLTIRSLGQQTIGAESVQLTDQESGLRAHNHTMSITGFPIPIKSGASGVGSVGFAQGQEPAGAVVIENVAAANAVVAHSNMQPSAVIMYIIKAL